jgi:type II secretory pathway component PulM
MALTQRERYIAYGLGAVVLGWGVYAFAVGPYFTDRSELKDTIQADEKKLKDADDAAVERKARETVWEYLKTSGLDNSLADSRLGQMIEYWANHSTKPEGAYFRVTGGNQSRGTLGTSNSPLAKYGFQEVKVQLQATGNQKGLSWILWNLERANVPVKVNEISVKPKVEGRDDQLNITLNLSTLALAPNAGRTP